MNIINVNKFVDSGFIEIVLPSNKNIEDFIFEYHFL